MKMIKITQELIESGQSGYGGWTKEQLSILGVAWPPLRGWRVRALGREISESAAEKFVALKGQTLRRQKNNHRKHGKLANLILNFDADN